MAPKHKQNKKIDKAFLFVNEDFNTIFGGVKNSELDRSKQSHVQRQSFVRRRELDSKGARPVPNLRPDVAIDGLSQTVQSLPDISAAKVAAINIEDAYYERVAGEQDEQLLQYFIDADAHQSSTSWDSIEKYCTAQYPHNDNFTEPNIYPEPTIYTYSSSRSDFWASNTAILRKELLQTDYCVTSPLYQSLDSTTDIKVTLEEWAPRLMRYHSNVMLCQLFGGELKRTSLGELRHVTEIHADMQSCMTYPEEMYALLTSTSFHILAHRAHLGFNSITQENYRKVPQLLNTKAVEALRIRLLRGSPTHGTAIAVHRMVLAALYVHNYDAVETNYAPFLAMIKELGGLETFSDYHKERLIFHDLVYAFATSSPPRLELSWDPGPLPRAIQQGISAQMKKGYPLVCEGLSALVDSKHDLTETILFQTLRDIVEVQRAAGWIDTQPYRPQYYRWLIHKRLALLHRLLSDRHLSCGSRRARGMENAYEALRSATALFMILNCALSNKVIRTSTQVATIATSLLRISSSSHPWPLGRKLVLWIVVIAGICTVMSPETGSPRTCAKSVADADDSLFFSILGRSLCDQLEIRTLAELRQLLDDFLFSDNLAGCRLEAFAEVGLGLRTHQAVQPDLPDLNGLVEVLLP